MGKLIFNKKKEEKERVWSLDPRHSSCLLKSHTLCAKFQLEIMLIFFFNCAFNRLPSFDNLLILKQMVGIEKVSQKNYFMVLKSELFINTSVLLCTKYTAKTFC